MINYCTPVGVFVAGFKSVVLLLQKMALSFVCFANTIEDDMSRVELQIEDKYTSVSSNQMSDRQGRNQFFWFLAITGTVFAGSGLCLIVWLLLNLV